MVLQNIMAVYFSFIIDLTMSKQAQLCPMKTPYSYGITWGISCGIHSTTLRCLLKLVTQIFSSMIIIIDSWFSCYKWFSTSRWNSLNIFKYFHTSFSSSGYIHIYRLISPIEALWSRRIYRSWFTLNGSHTSTVWFPVNRTFNLLAFERI